MLRQEIDFKYIIYPSWAVDGYAYAWHDLPAVLADPLSTGRFERPDEFDKYRSLYSPPTRFVDGPRGGGIIIEGPAPRAASNIVLNQGVANVRVPDDMRPFNEVFPTYVALIEPFDGLGGLFQTGKRARNYPVRATVEHAAHTEGHLYWVFSLSKLPGSLAPLDDVATLARGFGLIASPTGSIPAKVGKDVEPWLVNGNEVQSWFQIEQGDDRLGFQFAVLLYAATHLKRSMRRLKWAHLVGQIEGRPNPRLIAMRRLQER
jgi:hypothetical protein